MMTFLSSLFSNITLFMLVNLVISVALVVVSLVTIINARLFPRLGKATPEDPPPPSDASLPPIDDFVERMHHNKPLVSILIPARDEADVIGQTVESLLAQDYGHVEILILDDDSSDGTARVAREAGQGDPRLRVLWGEDLPAGWLGKNWACWQMAQHARGKWLLFTDADVQWQPNGLSTLLAQADETYADLLTVWPTQITRSWGERLVVPLMAFVVLGYLPLPFVHRTRWPAFAAANGQCMLWRRQAYRETGGHKQVRDNVLEDVSLARQAKAKGLRLRMADAAGFITCRMYNGWSAVQDGYAKNILAGYGNNPALLILGAIFHWALFLWPAIWLVLGFFFAGVRSGWPVWPLTMLILGILSRGISAVATRQRLADALLLPVSVILMSIIAAKALWWHWRGGPEWKGRRLK